MSTVDEALRDQVRDRYARAALTVTEAGGAGTTADCCGGGGGAGRSGMMLYQLVGISDSSSRYLCCLIAMQAAFIV